MDTSIINWVHERIPFFREQWATFCDMVEQCGKHVDECSKDPKLRVNTKRWSELEEAGRKIRTESGILTQKLNEAYAVGDKELRDELEAQNKEIEKRFLEVQAEIKAVRKPIPDYEPYEYWNYIYLNVPMGKLHLVSTQIANPVLWFDGLEQWGHEIPSSDEESLLMDCVILAVAHGECDEIESSEPHIYRNDKYAGKFFRQQEFCRDLYLRLRETDNGRLQRAFERVNAYIDKGDNVSGLKEYRSEVEKGVACALLPEVEATDTGAVDESSANTLDGLRSETDETIKKLMERSQPPLLADQLRGEHDRFKTAARRKAQDAYVLARQKAIRIRESDPSLSPLPPIETTDFIMALQTIQEWCIDAAKAKAPPPKPTEAEDKSGDTGRPAGTGDTDPKADRKTANDWKRWHKQQRKKKNYRASYAEYAKENGLKAHDVKKAVDRHRKRTQS